MNEGILKGVEGILGSEVSVQSLAVPQIQESWDPMVLVKAAHDLPLCYSRTGF